MYHYMDTLMRNGKNGSQSAKLIENCADVKCGYKMLAILSHADVASPLWIYEYNYNVFAESHNRLGTALCDAYVPPL